MNKLQNVGNLILVQKKKSNCSLIINYSMQLRYCKLLKKKNEKVHKFMK